MTLNCTAVTLPNTFLVDNFTAVAASNQRRYDEGQNMALVAYAFAGLTHVLMSLLVALAISWRVPESTLALMPYATDVRVATFYWWYAWLSMSFLISCAGGTITMMITVIVYNVILYYIAFDALCNVRMRCAERYHPPDRGGRSLAAAQRIDWLETGGLRGVSQEQMLAMQKDKKGGGAAGGGAASRGSPGASVNFLDMDKIPIFEPLPDAASAGRLSQKEQRAAVEKIASIVKQAKEGTGDDKKKPWSYYPDHSPDGSPSDTQIALEEAAAWKVRRAFNDMTDMTENGQLRDADSGVIVGSKMETAMRLARMLMRYSPGSLHSMEQILESYRLQEDRLFTDLEAKYGPEPTRLERKRWVGQQRARGSMSAEDVAKSFTVPELPDELYWTRCPVAPVRAQCAAIVVCAIFVLICVGAGVSAVFWWPIPDYRVIVDVHANGQHLLLSQPEVKPSTTAKAEFLIYGWPGTASEMRVQQYLNFITTQWYPFYFHQKLETAEEKKSHIEEGFIQPYKIDMSPYINCSYLDYDTADHWWGRQIKHYTRPLAPRWDFTGSVLTPCDARYTAFTNVVRARRFWIKGGRFSYEELINGKDSKKAVQGNPDYFTGGALILARLAAADYHRFHAPVSGRILEIWRIKKHWFSTTPTAVQSGNNVLFNTRWTVLIDTNAAAENIAQIKESAPSADPDWSGSQNTQNQNNNNNNNQQQQQQSTSYKSNRKPVSPPSMGVVAMVLIGSTYAGSVEFGHRNFTSTSHRDTPQPLVPGTWVKAGDELGRFRMGGSTVALLFRSGAIKVQCDVVTRSAVAVETLKKMGERVAVNRGTVDGDDADFCI